MKKTILITSILFLITSCTDIDGKFENSSLKDDFDDINIIDKVGKQSLDKAMDMHYTRTHAS